MRHGIKMAFGVASLAAGAIAACGGSSEGGGSVGPIPHDQLASRAASALCDNIGDCCAKNGWTHDASACKQGYEALVEEFFITPAVKGGATYDAQAAGTCVSSLSDVAKSCGASDVSAACDRIFIGTKPNGAQCEHSIECAAPPGGDAYCDVDDFLPGTCVQEPRGKAGDGCSGTCTDNGSFISCSGGGTDTGSALCWTNDDLFCSDGTCQPLIAIGDACQWSGCVDDAYCTSAGVCAAKLPAGGDCGSDWSACADGLYCDAAGVCAAKKPDGAACSDWEECVGSCEDNQCVNDTGFISAALCSGTWSSGP
jgi:hypothetical protein